MLLVPAAEIDVAYDALADEGVVQGRRLLDNAAKLMANYAAKAHVPLEDLEVSVADGCDQNAHERLAWTGRGHGHVLDAPGLAADDKGFLHIFLVSEHQLPTPSARRKRDMAR